jgi:RsiW-degrading membrane proteinase PrsW (M82 family)
LRLLFLIFISITPGALWVWYFARNERNREPLGMLSRAFIAGTLSVIPAAILERPLRPLLTEPTHFATNALFALLAIGLIEEGVKLAAAYFATFQSHHFDEVGDGIVYAVTEALGFAAIDNLFYTATFGVGVAVVRAVITSLAHASFAGVFGFWLGLYKLGRAGVSDLWRGFLIAAGLHSLYDFVIMSRIVSPIFAIVLVYVVYRYVVGKLREVSA